ncbi:TonB-dependent receptor [Flavihumibacter solisilvae]|uniref:TonB-dependent receptor n=1 Tax=Flavihumibacter solisilvae TaxID=1349421 RepID=A0A0C1L4N7_9BACT|nr:TonB-dependent receptor [Flavihumibacter solisilvae]
MLAWSGTRAQVRPITGTVTNGTDNSPLAGVSVSVKGKNAGTQTAQDGTFTIHASAPDQLVFSYLGFESKTVTVGEAVNITVVLLRSEKKMDEVVVVGYGTQSRKNVTSSIAKLDKDVLATAPRANVGTALQGTVSGVQVVNSSGQPGASPYILLRGGANINSPGAPLVVVDGIIRSLNDIVAEDIASMEILKDASATAIYGARANNGVILITTKQGKSGNAQVSYKFTGGYNQRRDGYDYLGAKDYIYYNRLGNFNSGRTLAQVNSSRGYGLNTDSANLSSFDIRRYDAATNGHLLSQGWDTIGDPYGGTIIFKDHGGEVEDIVFRNTFTQDHYINVSGGNEKGKYFASFDYYKEDGVIVGSSYKRYSGTLNGSYKIKPNIELSTGVILSTSSRLGVNGSEVNTLYRSMAIWPTFNPWLDAAKTQPNPGLSSSDGNPLYWLGKVDRNNQVNRVTANASVKWDLLPGLFIKASANAYMAEELNESFSRANQTYINIFSATQPSFNDVSRPAYSNMFRDFQQQYNAIANYTKTIGDDHNISVMAGTEYFGTNERNMQVMGTKAPTDDITTVNASTVFAPNTSTNPYNPNNNFSYKSEYRIISAFGRLNYDYAQKYLLSLVFRQDAVSSLAKENRAGFFPGMSAGWNLHREKFFENLGLDRVITTFKPRFSYGENGNVSVIGRYDVQGIYSSPGLYNGAGAISYTSPINGDLRWEKSKTIDLGLDLAFLQNRITIMFDYYDRKNSDLLTDLALPGYTGFNTFKTNLGTLQNKGYEVTVTANVLNNQNGVKLDLGANASFVKNRILELPYNGQQNNRQGGLQVYDPKTGRVEWVGGLQEGQPIGAIYAYKQVGIFKNEEDIAKFASSRVDMVANISGPNSTHGTGKITPGDVNWMDVDRNDTIDSRDQVYIGNINPKWTGGFTANVSYKGFSLYSRFEFALGHTIYNDLVARTLGNYQGTFNYFDLQKSAWSPENTDTDIPKVYYADQVSAPLGKKNYTRSNNANANLNSNNSRFYEKGDYLACREITLSYDFPRQLLGRTKVLSQARLFVSGNNLFYVTDFTGPTPEPPISNGRISGVYTGTYPTPKTFVFGAQVTF